MIAGEGEDQMSVTVGTTRGDNQPAMVGRRCFPDPAEAPTRYRRCGVDQRPHSGAIRLGTRHESDRLALLRQSPAFARHDDAAGNGTDRAAKAFDEAIDRGKAGDRYGRLGVLGGRQKKQLGKIQIHHCSLSRFDALPKASSAAFKRFSGRHQCRDRCTLQ
ncbi:hypothetical protein [Sphingomonas beigongshangi]|nr:hypothetical protein [Sphingomonas beigongshangi]